MKRTISTAITLAALAAGCAASPDGGEDSKPQAQPPSPPQAQAALEQERTAGDPRLHMQRVDTSQRMVFPAGMASARAGIRSCHRVAPSHHDCPAGYDARFLCQAEGTLPAGCQELASQSDNETAVCCAR